MSDTPHRNRLIRQVRQMRLLGKPVAEIAGIVGLHRATVYKLIQRNGLDGPEEWMERPRLALHEAIDEITEQLAASQTGEAQRAYCGVLTRLIGELRRLEVTVAKWRGEQDAGHAGCDNQESHSDTDETDEDSDDAEDELSPAAERRRLAAYAAEFQTKGEAGQPVRPDAPVERGRDTSGQPESLDPERPRYTGSAAGRLAEFRLHGRTRRWQDTGGGRMAALVNAAGRVWPRGAGGPGLARCARSDDRRAERPEMDRAAEVSPPILFAQPPDPEL